jgi:NADPH2:quinone reductase
MRAAVLEEAGVPRLGEFEEPTAGDGSVVVSVLAAGINHLDLAKAGGSFYTGPPTIPSVPGSDGVGRLADGTRVYFDEPVAPFGSMAERALVDPAHVFPIRDEVDDAVAAAAGNAGIAAMLALTRARMQAGERVLILGGTGTVGRIAAQAASALGAAEVVAAGRDAEARIAAAGGVFDVIVDPVWGEPALAAMNAAAPRARMVQIGQRAAATIDLPAALLRSRRLELIGVAGVLEPHEDRAAAYAHLLDLIAGGSVEIELERVTLDDVESAWHRQAEGAGRKLVVIP